MKFAKLAILATAPAMMAVTPIAANAQDAGTTIFSQEETPTEVGTVISNDGTTVLVDTGTYEAPLPANLFAQREGNWTINATKEIVNNMMAAEVAKREAAAEAQAAAEAEAAAKLAAALTVGNEVVTVDAQTLGTISELTEAGVVVTNDEVGLVTLPREFFALDAEENLVARANLADILAAVQGG